MMRVRIFLVGAAAAAIVLSGCSGSSSDGDKSTGTTAAEATTTAPAETTTTAEDTTTTVAETSTTVEEIADAETTATVPVEEDATSADPNAVSGSDVAATVNYELTKIVGRSPDDVTCPDLPGVVGAAIRCTLTDGDQTFGVSVTVTSVEGTDVKFGIKVDDQPS